MHAPKGTMPPYERQAKPSKGNFLSWDAGESKDLVILSEQGTVSHTHWVAGESKDCTGEGCPLCAMLTKRSIRWTVDTKCEGEELPWEMSNTTFFGVEDVAEMVGHLKDLRLRVTRHGTGMKTRYSVLPLTGEETPHEKDVTLAWYVQEIKGLCKLAGMDPKQELKLFLTEIEPGAADYTPLDQMRAFHAYIDAETHDLQHPDEPPPDEEQDIGRYF